MTSNDLEMRDAGANSPADFRTYARTNSDEIRHTKPWGDGRVIRGQSPFQPKMVARLFS